jgi:hypothetical protein
MHLLFIPCRSLRIRQISYRFSIKIRDFVIIFTIDADTNSSDVHPQPITIYCQIISRIIQPRPSFSIYNKIGLDLQGLFLDFFIKDIFAGNRYQQSINLTDIREVGFLKSDRNKFLILFLLYFGPGVAEADSTIEYQLARPGIFRIDTEIPLAQKLIIFARPGVL